MLVTRFKEAWPRYVKYQDEEPDEAVDARHPGDAKGPVHDPLLRYATLGIFLILFFAALKIAQAVALPVTAGVLLGLVLGPLADWMSNRGVPRGLAAALITAGFVALALAAVALLAAPVAVWSDQIPALVGVFRRKVADALEFVKVIGAVSNPGVADGATKTVVVADNSNPMFEIAVTSSAAAASFLLSVVTMYFYLGTRRLIKARALRLCLGHEARKSAGAFFDRIEDRVAHYLIVVTVINGVMGVLVGLVAWAAGFSYPAAWAAFAAIMNYIPLVGPLVVAAALAAAGLLVAPTAGAALWPAALYFLLHVAESQVVTPGFVGRRLTVSPLMVFLSFAFWFWLWGPGGAVLATPILLVAYVAKEVFGEYRKSVADVPAQDAAQESAQESAQDSASAPPVRQREVA